jgi:hypothetical protein
VAAVSLGEYLLAHFKLSGTAIFGIMGKLYVVQTEKYILDHSLEGSNFLLPAQSHRRQPANREFTYTRSILQRSERTDHESFWQVLLLLPDPPAAPTTASEHLYNFFIHLIHRGCLTSLHADGFLYDRLYAH